MNNLEVIKKFLTKEKAKTPTRYIQNGYYTYKGNTLTSDGKILINYSTPIAYFDNNNRLYLNTDKYSVTTSKIQHTIRMTAISYFRIAMEVTEKELKEIIKKESEVV